MQTKMLVKKPEVVSSKTNNPVNNNLINNKPVENKKKVRTTDYKKLMQIMLNNPDAITKEEFLLLQSVIGYRRAVAMREEEKLRKKQSKIGQTNIGMKPITFERSNSQINKDSYGNKEASELKNDNEKNPLRMKKDDGNTSASSSSMQHNLRAGLEKLSGVDLSDVKVHLNSDKPQQVGALAYTQGNDIHVAPGQEKHIPHEGWHAVQQKQGIVKPTMQMKTGALVNDNAGLEKEADVMGAKAEKEGLQTKSLQPRKLSYIQQKSTVIQRITQEEAMRISKENTNKQEKTSNDDITTSAFGEKSENVRKIQQVLIRMNYWTGEDKATGYFGNVTKDSLIKFQLGYMKLQRKDLFDKNGNYVGCGPKTAKSLNNLYKLLYNSNVPEQAKNSIMEIGKNKENNSSYSWDIKAGEYNGNVKEAQLMLMNLGYKLPEYGADGKWSKTGETYNAILEFQKSCNETYLGVKKNGGAERLKQIAHFEGIYPSGKLDEKTYKALKKEVSKKVSVGGVKPNNVNKQANKETGKGILSEQELRNQLGALIKEHLNFVEENKNIGFYSTDKSIDIVLKYDKTISDVSEQLGIPKAMIQAVLFKEIRMKDARDVLADSFVIEYYRYNHAVEDYDKLSFWQKVFVGPPQPANLMREDSSTGLGQIFAKTAIDAYNAGISRGDISGSNIDYNDWHQREKVWNELRDDKTNIFYAGLVLKQKAEILKIDLNNITNNEIEKTLARYNGFGNAAAEYGIETKQYYDLFTQFNK